MVADTGSPHSTAELVGAVSRFRDENGAEFDAVAAESARIAREGERAIAAGDAAALGGLMSESHAYCPGLASPPARATRWPARA